MSWLVPHRLGVIMKMEYSPGSERPANESHFSCYSLAVIKIFMPRVTGESRKFKREERTPSRELSLFLQSENQVAAVKSPSSSVGHQEVDLLTGALETLSGKCQGRYETHPMHGDDSLICIHERIHSVFVILGHILIFSGTT